MSSAPGATTACGFRFMCTTRGTAWGLFWNCSRRIASSWNQVPTLRSRHYEQLTLVEYGKGKLVAAAIVIPSPSQGGQGQKTERLEWGTAERDGIGRRKSTNSSSASRRW